MMNNLFISDTCDVMFVGIPQLNWCSELCEFLLMSILIYEHFMFGFYFVDLAVYGERTVDHIGPMEWNFINSKKNCVYYARQTIS